MKLPKLPPNFFQSLAAVLLGNALYFLLMPHLPPRAQHAYNRLDLGLVVDFWICLIFYGLIELVWRRRHRRRN